MSLCLDQMQLGIKMENKTRFKALSTLTFVSALMTGCASINHTVTQIDTNVFQIGTQVYNGYGTTNISRPAVERATLVAAAKKSTSIGCQYFAAIANNAQSLSQTQVQTSGDTFQQNPDGSVQYRTAQGQEYRIVKPSGRSNTYMCFKERPSALLPGLIFNAELVAKSN